MTDLGSGVPPQVGRTLAFQWWRPWTRCHWYEDGHIGVGVLLFGKWLWKRT